MRERERAEKYFSASTCYFDKRKELTTLLFQYEGLGKYSTQNDK